MLQRAETWTIDLCMSMLEAMFRIDWKLDVEAKFQKRLKLCLASGVGVWED